MVELIAAKILGPTLWGIWYLLNLIIAYRDVLNLGITNGMNREVPINLGKDDEVKAKQVENVTFTTVLLSAALASIIISLSLLLIKDPNIVNSLLWLIPLFVVTQFYYLVNTSLKANSLFHYISKKQFIFSVIFPVFAVPFTYLFKLEGFIAAFTLALLISVGFIYKISSISYAIRYDWNEVKNLIRIGFPIMAVGIAYTFLNTVDRWIIGIFLGAEELGYYSMAIIVFGGMTLFPKVISQQLYPRMAYDWGKSNSIEELRYWTWLQTKYTGILIFPLLVGVLTIFPWIIKTFLPQYTPGIFPLQIIVFGALFMPFSAGWGNVLNIIDKQTYYLVVILFAIIMNLGINYLFVVNGYGIEGIALGTVITFALYNLTIMIIGRYFLKRI
ncbi:oligosaccharide flippase family protein [Pleurocapsales cyanobacterium LEGE 10410]|nr:oligosaccharide flippase family protein [Pleurocapsales cyanobacterium LEGE 10410]